MSELSQRAIRLIDSLAQKEASEHWTGSVLPEHVLLALINSKEGLGFEILKKIHIDIESLKSNLIKSFFLSAETPSVGKIPLSRRSSTLFNVAALEARSLQSAYIGTEHILLASLREEKAAIRLFFQENLIPFDEIRKLAVELQRAEKENSKNYTYQLDQNNILFTGPSFNQGRYQQNQKQNQNQQASFLNEFSRDITQKALDGEIDPVVGREKEIQRVVQILSRRTKNNPILVGEPGVGKTAIVEGLAQRIVAKTVPQHLLNKKIYTLDLASVIAGTKYRGEFEERLKRIMKEIKERKNIILFIDELHTIIGAGGAEGTMDASNMLKPALSRGELQCVGATTLKEYRKYFEKDAALVRRFQQVIVDEPSEEETIEILEGLKKQYEDYHQVRYDDDVIPAITRMAKRYLTERFLPDKAIDILDEAGAMKKLSEENRPIELEELEDKIALLNEEKKEFVAKQDYEEAARIRDEVRVLKQKFEMISSAWQSPDLIERKRVDMQDVCKTLAVMTGLPKEQLSSSDAERLLQMEEEIHKSVVGQEHAIKLISSAVRRSRAGVSSGKRPLGSFIFLGPTGVGKTLLAKTLAKFLFGNEDSLIRIDMSDYMEKHNSSRLVGAPPGYVGFEEGGLLTEKVRRNPYSIVLLDEIEKAHKDVFNLLLQILEEGEIRDSLGHVVNFRNTIIIMTSNAGAREISNENRLGFSFSKEGLLSAEEIKMSATAELKKIMSPELLNRIDDIVVFEVLTEAEIAAIFDIEFYELQKRILDLHIHLEISANAKKYFIKNGYDPVFGARPMRRLIQKEIEDVLATKIIEGSFSTGDQVRVELRGEALMLKIIQKTPSTSKDLLEVSETFIETSSEEKEITKV